MSGRFALADERNTERHLTRVVVRQGSGGYISASSGAPHFTSILHGSGRLAVRRACTILNEFDQFAISTVWYIWYVHAGEEKRRPMDQVEAYAMWKQDDVLDDSEHAVFKTGFTIVYMPRCYWQTRAKGLSPSGRTCGDPCSGTVQNQISVSFPRALEQEYLDQWV